MPSSSLSGVCRLILFPLFAAGVVYTDGNLPPASLTPAANLSLVSLTPVANLPPVSTTQGELMAKFAAGVIDTGGKFAAGVVDTGSNFPPVANLPPVLLTPVVHLACEYLPEFSKKFEMILMLLSGAWGKVIHGKNLKQKSRDTVPLSCNDVISKAD